MFVGELSDFFSRFWTGEFERFYNPETGFDIDGVWIDMNEPSNVRCINDSRCICVAFIILGSIA